MFPPHRFLSVLTIFITCIVSAGLTRAGPPAIAGGLSGPHGKAHLTSSSQSSGGSAPLVGTPADTFPGAPAGAQLTYTAGGHIMPSVTAYTVFWEPAGYSFDATATDSTNPHCLTDSGDAAFECIINQFIEDLNGSSFYNILTQYYQTDTGGGNKVPIQNSVTLGGTWTDTTAYPGPHCSPLPSGYTACVNEQDIEGAVTRAAQHFGVSSGDFTHLFIVLTPLGVEQCAGGDCATDVNNGFCSYHDLMVDPSDTSTPYIFDDMFDEGNFSDFCDTPTASSTGLTPNGDRYADSEIDSMAHEVFEAVSDPAADYPAFGDVAWYDDPDEDEIADLCQTTYGPVDPNDGHNLVLAGDKYIAQSMFSNNGDGKPADGTDACTLSYSPGSTASLIAGVRVTRSGRALTVRWRVPAPSGLEGFALFTGTKRIGPHLIPAHTSRAYRLTVRVGSASRLAIHVLLASGRMIAVPVSSPVKKARR